MNYSIETTRKFDKALKKCIKRGLNIDKFKECVKELSENGTLSEKYRPHKLSNKSNNTWECHIESDWLLVWEQNDFALTLLLIDTGSHSDIFG
ncbi:MAG: type II toxin-antitoxin system YafQ family toxin [Muribaculum sp.]|nr:type II toxin-antitoxin system YafQ family toxin [Muribaculum sp.]